MDCHLEVWAFRLSEFLSTVWSIPKRFLVKAHLIVVFEKGSLSFAHIPLNTVVKLLSNLGLCFDMTSFFHADCPSL